ncbi:RIP metalloprotease RseP [bacterium]|jgi:regulator of sigma E protease|nr:RIP metalloprotease RseP [bacterium]
MSFLITLFALGFVIFIHEMGHMVAAKRSGIGVLEFAVGMGPKLYGKQVGETLYSIRVFPFGGFVKLAGLDDDENSTCDPALSFKTKPLASRFITIVAGSAMNIVLGFLIFVIMYSMLGVPTPTPVVSDVFPNTPASEVGIRKGDRLVSLEGASIQDVKMDFIKIVHASKDTPLQLQILRDGVTSKLSITPRGTSKYPTLGLIGVRFDEEVRRYNPIKGLWLGSQRTYTSISNVFLSLSMLIRQEANLGDVAGPIGIVQLASFHLDTANGLVGVLNFLNIMALISISLGVMNLLPFPVLDGGHLIFLIIEGVIGRPVNSKWETVIHNTGAALLITVMVLVVFNDIMHWKNRLSILQKAAGL